MKKLITLRVGLVHIGEDYGIISIAGLNYEVSLDLAMHILQIGKHLNNESTS